MRVVAAPVGAKFADTYGPVTTAAQAAALAATASIVLRYENLTEGELELLFGAGLLVGLIVTAPPPGTAVSGALAQAKYGEAAEHFAADLAAPAGASVLIDLETLSGDPPGYAVAAASVLASGDLAPATYVGAGAGFTSDALYALPVYPYLKGMSRVEDPAGALVEPACGWCGYQVYPGDQSLAGGLVVDFGVLGTDYRGRTLALLGA